MSYNDVNSLTDRQATALSQASAPADSVGSRDLYYGSWAALKEYEFTIIGVTLNNITLNKYFKMEMACRVRAVVVSSDYLTDATNNIEVLIRNTTKSNDIFNNGTDNTRFIFDASPAITAGTPVEVTTGTPAVGTAALQSGNIENIDKGDVIKFEVKIVDAAPGTHYDLKPITVRLVVEPPLADTSKTTDATRTYRQVARSVDA